MFEAQLVIAVAGSQVEKILLHATYTSVYRHIIVVENDKKVVRGGRSVVQSFES